MPRHRNHIPKHQNTIKYRNFRSFCSTVQSLQIQTRLQSGLNDSGVSLQNFCNLINHITKICSERFKQEHAEIKGIWDENLIHPIDRFSANLPRGEEERTVGSFEEAISRRDRRSRAMKDIWDCHGHVSSSARVLVC